jgi:uncharacterized protein YndB with AHSA1/START domain
MKTETAQKLSLEVRRVIDAPPERVFEAWTQPAQIKQWMGADDDMEVPSATVELRVGGRFRIQIQRADGEFFTAVGTYREIKPPERLVFTWDWEKDGSGTEFGELEGNETLVTLEFHARGKQTEVVLRHEKFTSQESRDRHEGGWERCLASLASFLVGK